MSAWIDEFPLSAREDGRRLTVILRKEFHKRIEQFYLGLDSFEFCAAGLTQSPINRPFCIATAYVLLLRHDTYLNNFYSPYFVYLFLFIYFVRFVFFFIFILFNFFLLSILTKLCIQ